MVEMRESLMAEKRAGQLVDEMVASKVYLLVELMVGQMAALLAGGKAVGSVGLMAASMAGQLDDLMVHSWVETMVKKSVLGLDFELVSMLEKQLAAVLVPLQYKLGRMWATLLGQWVGQMVGLKADSKATLRAVMWVSKLVDAWAVKKVSSLAASKDDWRADAKAVLLEDLQALSLAVRKVVSMAGRRDGTWAVN